MFKGIRSWGIITLIVGFLWGTSVTLAGVVDLDWAKWLFLGGALILALRVWFEPKVRGSHPIERYLIRLITVLALGGLCTVMMYAVELKRPKPSFVYVVPTWVEDHWAFTLLHEGSEPTLKVHLLFSEVAKDYINRALTPEDIRRTTLGLDVDEVDPEPQIGPHAGFAWSPLSQEHEEFMVLISCRDGSTVSQHILAERIKSDKWAFAKYLTVYKRTTLIPAVVRECQDQGFPPSNIWFKKNVKSCR